MAQSQENATSNHTTPAASGSAPIDLDAQAGTSKSLGTESVRDGRPSTGDDTVEAMDEEGPGITAPLDAARDKPAKH